MFDFDSFETTSASTLTPPEKAAAVLLAMGRQVAGKLLKYFTQAELQVIIHSAQRLRQIPPNELIDLVNEFEDLFTEGAGLMDNAKAIEGILEEGLTPDEVDGLLGRRAAFQAYETTIWEQLESAEPAFVAKYLINEHPQTIAYIMSMMPSSAGAKVLLEMPEARRADILNRTVNLRDVNPKAVQVIENRVQDIIRDLNAERNAPGTMKVAELMNELEKNQVENLLDSLEAISQEAAKKVRPKIFLFEDLLVMPQRSRVMLFNDIAGDVITMALRGASMDIREAVLSSIGARQRRMIESDLGAPDTTANPRTIAIARRSIAQEAIRLAANGQIQLKESGAVEAA
ncbi:MULTISPECIES: flagellar motor switch protein FliG [unclassified Rhizobium]|uniref:flagellar motor switch protein FliG n=1 Tax=unclassified Rhizobium TaxID=2613769 RepID=UPI0015FFFA4A|nr:MULTISPECIES: flagellar motor switch protein FliG [unclassified Rhizobium]MBB1248774.1 flagellar motor switch protein FliG [Rhizobium sp. G21]MCV3766229.1 flagellar motor switch protein FliG [Rhizobium sp. TRM95796]